MKSITVSLVSLLAGQANAWWGTGHLLTARIAYDRLIALDREDVIELVETELSVLDSFVHIEKNHPFVEAATFADWIKNAGWLTTEDWHFIDTPIFDEGFSKEVTSDKHNVEWVIDLMRKQIIDPIGKQWWPNTQPFPPVDPSLSRSFNIRMLIHFIGDMHQPLHSVSRYTADFPNGDQGGNLFQVKPQEPYMNVSNLHSVWDTAGIVYADFIVQPLSEEDWLYLGKQAFEISMADPYSSFDIENLTRPESEWYEETYEIARTVVYPGAIQNQVQTPEYLEKVRKVARRQLAKGGYRLADFLINLMDDLKLSAATDQQSSI